MDGIVDLMDMSFSKLQEIGKDRQDRPGRPGVLKSRVAKSCLVAEQQQQFPELPGLANKKYCQWCMGHRLKNLFDTCLKFKFNWMLCFT